MKDKKFRQYIASLPCMQCKIESYSQAAHLGGLAHGKGKGCKACDSTCRPLCCDRPGVTGCHTKLDQHKEGRLSEEQIEQALQMPLYDLFKSGELEEIRFKIMIF